MSGGKAFDPNAIHGPESLEALQSLEVLQGSKALQGLEVVRRRPEMFVGPLEGGAGWLTGLNRALSWIYRQARSRCGPRQTITLRGAEDPCGPFRFEWDPARADAPPFVEEAWTASLSRLDNADGTPNHDGLGVLNALSQELHLGAQGRGFGFGARCETEASIDIEPIEARVQSDEFITLTFRPGPVLAPHPPAPAVLRGYLLCFSDDRPLLKLVIDLGPSPAIGAP